MQSKLGRLDKKYLSGVTKPKQKLKDYVGDSVVDNLCRGFAVSTLRVTGNLTIGQLANPDVCLLTSPHQ